MSQEFENEHPRDDDGQFEKKDGGGSRNTTEREECDKPKTYRQNASYPEIIAADRAERERAAQLGGGGVLGKNNTTIG